MESTIQALERLINRLLAMDVESRDALARYSGRTLAVEVRDRGWTLYLTIMEDGVCLAAVPPGTVDVTVRGTPAQFLGLLREGGHRAGGAAGSFEIAGDVAMAQAIQAILRDMDLDWEEPLSAWVGDTLAHKMGRVVRSTGRYVGGARRTLEADLSEYLRYEKDVLPDRTEVDEFTAEVEELRNDVERLQARIRRLREQGGS